MVLPIRSLLYVEGLDFVETWIWCFVALTRTKKLQDFTNKRGRPKYPIKKNAHRSLEKAKEGNQNENINRRRSLR